MTMEHGGKVAEYFALHGDMPLDYSANLNPLGMPESVRQAAIDAMQTAEHYPDCHCRGLDKALEQLENVADCGIVWGNGAADLIYRLFFAHKPRRVVMPAPTFSEYAQAAYWVDCEVCRHVLRDDNGYALTEAFLQNLTPDTDMVFVCQPNNPTGVLTERTLLKKILRRCEEIDAILVVDECFLPFVEHAEDYTMRQFLTSDHLVILKAFTKTYAMAGLRLGYCLCSNILAERLRACGQPWAVSSVAQAAGLAAMKEPDYPQKALSLLRTEKPFLVEGLRTLGLTVTDPAANFLLFQGPPGLVQALYHNGILLRSCANFPALTDRHYRACIRTRAENVRFLEAMTLAIQTVTHQPE